MICPLLCHSFVIYCYTPLSIYSFIKTEREYYRKVCKESYDIVHKKYTENDIFNPPEVGSSPLPLSGPIIAHHSFDFAQQVHYPSDPWQPGPMYFKTPRKCAIFGIHCESIPRQVNYLIDEASVAGKGSNVVVSLLHHYLQHHSLGEQQLHLHADNCVGQNKNNVVIQYLMWRVLVGLNETVTLSFLPVGHTKFAPDWCFGMLKQRYRRTVVGKLADIAEVVEQSSELNYHQLVGMQDGTTIVHTFDWQKFLIPKFNKVQQIKSYHNFRFSNGTLFVSTWSDTEKKELSILKDHNWQPNPNELPDIIIPRGLDRERQWYLYDQLRHFCPDEESKDATCPLPSLPRPQRSQML